ncbi:MAG: MoxR family ATPase [Pseudomonadota bacterium]
MTLDDLRALAAAIKGEVAKTVHGQDEAVDLVLTALFAGSHVLIEGPPGTAKTLLVQSLAAALRLDFGRIQFTPDLMPGDVLGANIYNFSTGAFALTKGPVFTEVLLADEINRAPPKTQAALLQAMNERRVTLDGTDYPLGEAFTVIGTQNPLESQGTYPLPEAQLDRFLFKLLIDFPEAEAEVEILRRSAERTQTGAPLIGSNPVVDGEALIEGRKALALVRLEEPILRYIVEITRATRSDPDLLEGASTRAADALAMAARAAAALDGRDYVLPDDVKKLIPPAYRHRVVVGPTAEIEGRTADSVLAAILNRVEAPR